MEVPLTKGSAENVVRFGAIRDLLVGQLSIPHFLCLYLNLTADRIDLGLGFSVGRACWTRLGLYFDQKY